MKADLRISIKDYHRKNNLKILLFRPSLDYGPASQQFLVRMNGMLWLGGGGPVSLTWLITALRKTLVRTGRDRRHLTEDPAHDFIQSRSRPLASIAFTPAAPRARLAIAATPW